MVYEAEAAEVGGRWSKLMRPKLKLHVQMRCDKCSHFYEFDDDDNLFFLGIDPGTSIVSFSRPCGKCSSVGVTVVGISTHRNPDEDEWPDVIDA